VRSRQVCRATPPGSPFGSEEVSRSTLADATHSGLQVFSGLFAHWRAASRVGSSADRRSGAPDSISSSVRLSALSKDWARFLAGVCGAKMHIVYDPTPFARSMPLSRQPTSMTSLPPRSCRSRAGDNLRVRPSAIMTTAGGPKLHCRGLPDRDPAQEQHQAPRGRKNAVPAGSIFFPTASATCHNVWHATSNRSRIPSAKSACASTPERSYASSPMTRSTGS